MITHYSKTAMDGNEIIRAATGQPFGAMMPHTRLETVKANVVRAFGLRGLAVPDVTELDSITREIEAKIIRSYRHLTAAELAMVMEAGVSGELGKDVRVTCASVFGWIASYMASDIRREALRTGMRMRSAKRDMLSEEDLDAKNEAAEIRGAKALWAEFKTTGCLSPDHLDGYLGMVCDGLIRRGYIRPNDAAWEVARKKARAEEQRRGGVRQFADCLHAPKEKKFILLMYFTELYRKRADLPELR